MRGGNEAHGVDRELAESEFVLQRREIMAGIIPTHSPPLAMRSSYLLGTSLSDSLTGNLAASTMFESARSGTSLLRDDNHYSSGFPRRFPRAKSGKTRIARRHPQEQSG